MAEGFQSSGDRPSHRFQEMVKRKRRAADSAPPGLVSPVTGQTGTGAGRGMLCVLGNGSVYFRARMKSRPVRLETGTVSGLVWAGCGVQLMRLGEVSSTPSKVMMRLPPLTV